MQYKCKTCGLKLADVVFLAEGKCLVCDQPFTKEMFDFNRRNKQTKQVTRKLTMTKEQAINKANKYRAFIQMLVLGFKANPNVPGLGDDIEQGFFETMGEKLSPLEIKMNK